jgi:hypothetical protein
VVTFKVFKKFNSMQNLGCHGNQKKKLKISSFKKREELELSYLA